MWHGLRAILLLATSGVALAAGPSSPVSQLSGRYSHRFANGDAAGDSFTSENVVEIVPIDDRHAYVSMDLQFFNGHECGLYGVARWEGAALVYREPAEESGRDQHCVLTLKREGNKLRWSDGDASCYGHCGTRGTLSEGSLPLRSRQSLSASNLRQLRRSDEYREALNAWRKEGSK